MLGKAKTAIERWSYLLKLATNWWYLENMFTIHEFYKSMYLIFKSRKYMWELIQTQAEEEKMEESEKAEGGCSDAKD